MQNSGRAVCACVICDISKYHAKWQMLIRKFLVECMCTVPNGISNKFRIKQKVEPQSDRYYSINYGKRSTKTKIPLIGSRADACRGAVLQSECILDACSYGRFSHSDTIYSINIVLHSHTWFNIVSKTGYGFCVLTQTPKLNDIQDSKYI